MQRIGSTFDFATRLADLDRIRTQRRADRFARYQWPDGTHCAECGDTGFPPETPGTACYCKVGREEQERIERQTKWQSIVPRRFADYTLDTHPNQKAAYAVRQWVAVDAPAGRNLVLLGFTARGKTGLAIGALREMFANGYAVRFATVPDILAQLRPRDDKDQGPAATLYDLQSVPVLLMDDLGAEKMSEWASEQLYVIVNGRYERNLPTIVTSNLSMAEIEKAGGPRIVSRLQEDASILEIAGPDLRSRG